MFTHIYTQFTQIEVDHLSDCLKVFLKNTICIKVSQFEQNTACIKGCLSIRPLVRNLQAYQTFLSSAQIHVSFSILQTSYIRVPPYDQNTNGKLNILIK